MEKQKDPKTKLHLKKKIAPVIITLILIAYYIFILIFLFPRASGFIKVFVCVLPLVLAGFILYSCFERIKEIDGGEEDDLSQY